MRGGADGVRDGDGPSEPKRLNRGAEVDSDEVRFLIETRSENTSEMLRRFVPRIHCICPAGFPGTRNTAIDFGASIGK